MRKKIDKTINKLSKKAQIFETLLPWIIGIIILIIILLAYFFLSGKGNDAIEYFKTWWRFGR